MHIAFVIQDLYRQGAQYVTALLANGLAKRGHKIDVVVSDIHTRLGKERPELKPFALDEPVRLFVLPHRRSSRNVVALWKYFLSQRPDIITPMSSNYEPSCWVARLLLPVFKRPRIVPVEHSGGIGMKPSESRIDPNIRFMDHLYTRFFQSSGDHVVAVSQGVAQALQESGKYHPEDISVIANPVIDEHFWEKLRQPITHPWLKEKTVPVIVAAGSHVPVKGYDLLIQAFAQVLQTFPCRLIIFGEGEETEKYKQLANELGVAEHLALPGHTGALPAEMKAADLFVVSSHCESFSIVLVEALASGIPVVATDCPTGPREILHNGKYGVLVRANDINALSEGLAKALKGGAPQPISSSWMPYALEHIVAQYEALFSKMMVDR